ncbi:MAG: Integrase [Herminiimonas sp.]|nr:Integrase [Herminiimonas sp.]
MALTDLKIQSIRATDRAQKISDGAGMYLYVSQAGTKSWRIDYGFSGRRFTHTLGKYPQLSLAAARIKRSAVKQMLQNGVNPSAEKKIQKILLRSSVDDTFKAIATDWYSSKTDRRSPAWRAANTLYLERDLYPSLASLSVRTIDGKTVLATLEQCGKDRGLKTADRVRQTALQVFEHAMLKFKVDSNPVSQLKRWAEIPPRINRPHLNENEIHAFIEALDAYRGFPITKLAAKLLLLTFVRKTEIIEAKWEEFDIQNAKWLIPAERMKMREPHVVPLSAQALQTIKEIRTCSNASAYLFPKSSTDLKPLSRTALNNMFAKVANKKYKGKFSPHGIRATASTWLNEQGFRHDVIERQLAHSERNQVRASYNHADYLQERREMMEAWANFLFAHDIA